MDDKVIICPKEKKIISPTDCFGCEWLCQVSYEHGWVECDINRKERHFNKMFDSLDPELLEEI